MANYNFDGCLICGAVKDADRQGRSLSESELKRAFQAQEDKQQVATTQQLPGSKQRQQRKVNPTASA